MTFEQLRIFIAVAERLHMTRAAEALNLTQSAVSAAVTALETRYGVKLFDRIGRGLRLSSAGEAFLPEARAVLSRVDTARILLEDLDGLKRGKVRIHASQTIGAYWLPPRMAAFKISHPHIELELHIANTHAVIEAVLQTDAEIGLIEGAEDAPRLERWAVGADRLIIVASPRHRLAGQTSPLDARDLKALRWVVRETGSGTRSEFESQLPRGVSASDLDVELTLPSNEAILTAVAAGDGVTAISELAARPLIEAGRLAQLPLELPERPFCCLRHKERSLSRAAEAFTSALTDQPRP